MPKRHERFSVTARINRTMSARIGLLAHRFRRSPFNATPSLPQRVSRVAKTEELPTYSGGTAPAFHRTSLLRPFGHPRAIH